MEIEEIVPVMNRSPAAVHPNASWFAWKNAETAAAPLS